MKCDINKSSRDYKIILKKEKEKTTINFTPLNNCIQNSINHKLKILSTKDDVNYVKNEKKDYLTFNAMNNNTLSIYKNNFYYVIFKLSIFIFIISSYYLLSK